jgi:hypothetical protein
VSQTGRQFAERYQEDKAAYKHHDQNYSFARHLNKSSHSFGPMTETMQILHYQRKGAHLNTLEKYHIYTETKADNHLNDEHTIFPNTIFDLLITAAHHKTPLPPGHPLATYKNHHHTLKTQHELFV